LNVALGVACAFAANVAGCIVDATTRDLHVRIDSNHRSMSCTFTTDMAWGIICAAARECDICGQGWGDQNSGRCDHQGNFFHGE
jgi:hypothetical protein